MPKNAEKIRKRMEELRPDYGVLEAKRIAEKEHRVERLSELRVSAHLANDWRMTELIDIVREMADK